MRKDVGTSSLAKSVLVENSCSPISCKLKKNQRDQSAASVSLQSRVIGWFGYTASEIGMLRHDSCICANWKV